jgi:hypothetical protein
MASGTSSFWSWVRAWAHVCVYRCGAWADCIAGWSSSWTTAVNWSLIGHACSGKDYAMCEKRAWFYYRMCVRACVIQRDRKRERERDRKSECVWEKESERENLALDYIVQEVDAVEFAKVLQILLRERRSMWMRGESGAPANSHGRSRGTARCSAALPHGRDRAHSCGLLGDEVDDPNPKP